MTRREPKTTRRNSADAVNGRHGASTRQGPDFPGSMPSGLSSSEAAARLRRNGPNLLPQAQGMRWLGTLGSILREPMLLLLLVAAAIYWLLGDPQEAAALGVSVLLVIAVTAYQELKSEHALQALRDLSSPRARVLRDGTTRWIAARELVTGDVILLAEGDRVPADARIFGDSNLQVDESMLTGESVPVRHRSGPTMAHDESDLLGASTLVVGGQGIAEVIATGT
ncbi:MAG: HAD-IC family P-type ATPase, partial [Proteobacteria bacterium]|nr:HAD-IC family P-type ATPase [Pseudomonadota bacterium]